MVATLPEELLDSVQQQILHRQAQLEQLSLFYNQDYPSPQLLVAHGPEDTYKLETVQHVLERQNLDYVLINCKECLSQRHLLSKIFARCVRLLGKRDDTERYDRLDSINALVSDLKKLLQKRKQKLVVVLAGADQQRGATPTLLPALARLSDVVPCLSLILTSNSPRLLNLHISGVPYIFFPPFQRHEAFQILLQDPPPLLPDPLPSYCPTIKVDALNRIFSQFATVIHDTLVAPTTNSLEKYRQTCQRLWPRFIWPLVSGEKLPGKNTEWDFARLLSRNRILFQSAGEEALQERLISESKEPTTFEELISHKAQQDANPTPTLPTPLPTYRSPFKPIQPPANTEQQATKAPPLLKFLPTLILQAAYLASHTHNKHDIVLFSRLSTASSTNRRKKKYLARSRAGGISKTPTKSPSRKSLANGADDDDGDAGTPSFAKRAKEVGMQDAATPKKERADRSMRAIFEKTSNVARPFTLERLVAILRAIHPSGVTRGVADRVYAELGELERLRLVVRVDEKGGDESGLEERWRCVVGREWVGSAGRGWGLSIEGWELPE